MKRGALAVLVVVFFLHTAFLCLAQDKAGVSDATSTKADAPKAAPASAPVDPVFGVSWHAWLTTLLLAIASGSAYYLAYKTWDYFLGPLLFRLGRIWFRTDGGKSWACAFQRWTPQRIQDWWRRHVTLPGIERDLPKDKGLKLLTEEQLLRPADEKRQLAYYGGAQLGWDIIAAAADIDRDQHDSVLEKVRQPASGMRLICIVAEPGAGKSTFAWRLAADLYRNDRAIVVQLRNSADSAVWYLLEDFCTKVDQPICVLADDLFRDDEAASAFQDLDSQLPITVLSTSPRNEFRPERIKSDVVRVDLARPSAEEKERVLKKLGKTRSDLNPQQKERLDSADQFLVLMMELTSGRALHEIVHDSIDRLAEMDDAAYRAYEYLCFSCQYGISMPATLIERLDDKGRFHNLDKRATTEGLVLASDTGSGTFLRTGHAVIAKTGCEYYARKKDPHLVLNEIAAAVDKGRFQERRFFAHLLRMMALSRSILFSSGFAEPLGGVIDALVKSASSINELYIWREYYVQLGKEDEAEQCVDRMVATEPRSAWDCDHIRKFCADRGDEKRALVPVRNWVESNPTEWAKAGSCYLGLVRRHENDKDLVKAAIDKSANWLATHDAIRLRVAYLRLIEERTPTQLRNAIAETRAWLMQPHGHDEYARTAYMTIVERRMPEQIPQLIDEIRAWLHMEAHADDIHVRTKYMALVGAHSPALLEESISETTIWLTLHPEATEVWDALIRWLVRLGRHADANHLLDKAISKHPDDQNIQALYVYALQSSGDAHAVRECFKKLTTNYPNDSNFSLYFANWLSQSEAASDHQEAEATYIRLIDEYPKWPKARVWYGKLLTKLQRLADAELQFKTLLTQNFANQQAHNGLAHVRWRKKDHVLAEIGFQSAIELAKKKKDGQAPFYTDLGWFYAERRRWDEALVAFQSAAAEDPDYFGNYMGYAKAYIGLGKHTDAESALQTVLEKEPNLKPPASERFELLQRKCAELAGGITSVFEPDENAIDAVEEAPVGSVHAARVTGADPHFVYFNVAHVRARCHISKWSTEVITSLRDEVTIGDETEVKVIGHNSKGLNVSRVGFDSKQSDVSTWPGVGSIHVGQVTGADRHFVYFTVAGVSGRCHISKWSNRFVEALEDEAAPGEEYQVEVIGHRDKGLDLRRIAPAEDDGQLTIAKTDIVSAVAVVKTDIGTIVKGRVTGVKWYGVFVSFGAGVSGLCHISEWAEGSTTLEVLSGQVKVGDEISVMVIGENERGLLISRKAVVEGQLQALA